MTKLLAFMKEFEEDNGFAPRERDIFRSLVFDFTKGRHLHSRQKPKSLDEEVYCGVEYIYDLIRECTDLPTRSFLFRVALFLEDRSLLTRGLGLPAGVSRNPQPKYDKVDKAVLVISAAALLLTIIYLLVTAIPAILQQFAE